MRVAPCASMRWRTTARAPPRSSMPTLATGLAGGMRPDDDDRIAGVVNLMRVGVMDRGGGDDHPGRLPAADDPGIGGRLILGRARRRKQDREVEVVRGGGDALEQVDEHGMREHVLGDMRQHHGDRLGALRAQRARGEMRDVAKLCGGLAHPQLRFACDPRTVGQRHGGRRLGDAGKPGDVSEAYARAQSDLPGLVNRFDTREASPC